MTMTMLGHALLTCISMQWERIIVFPFIHLAYEMPKTEKVHKHCQKYNMHDSSGEWYFGSVI